MKKIMIAASMLFSSVIIAQQAPTPNPPNDPTTSLAAPQKGQYAWFRGGNLNTGNPATNSNIFGTMWNSPIYTHTNGINRMIVNGTRNATINNYANMNTSGYIGIGNPTYGVTNGNTPFFSTQGPFSLLHLNGLDGGGQEFGYRPWMKTGITFTEGFDLSYIGNRVVNATNDINEFTLAWSNDPTNPNWGPDDMVFRFINGNGNTVTNNFSSPSDLDGLHVARFTGTGLMGLGSTFGLAVENPGYVRPQSLLHMSLFNLDAVWMQITNQNGTNQTANDGLRLGIEAGNNQPAFLRWQELSPFIVQTDWDATAGGINNGERMRISSIGSNGVPKPANFIDDNVTRVAISHRGNSPITAPRSLLHLGYNTGNGFPGGGVVDGWRDWMDIGTFTNNGTDNIYVGLKEEGPDRFDAVINWGDNQVAGNTPNGPDNLRFIFTSTTTALPPGQGDPVSMSNNGLETARMVPTKASTLPASNFGMMGIGDWTTAFNIGNPIDAKLDIDGDLRIRTVTQDNNLTQILAIDPTDHNRVHWIDGSNLGGNVTANNGISVTTNNIVQLGVPCTDSIGNPDTTAILATQFTSDRVIGIFDHNFWLGTLNSNTGGVGIGGQPATMPFCNTGNTLEISANLKNTKYGNTDASGLRFSKLTSFSPTLANGTNGVDNTRVLSVDQDGDVVLVDAVGGGVGNYCSQPQNPLTDNYEIPLNNFNYHFTDPIGPLNQGENFVKIGDDCTTPVNAKLEVHRGITTNTQFNNIGALVVNEDDATNTFNWGFGHGILGNATGPNEQNSGVSGTSSNASTNYGGFFSSFTPFLGGSQNQNNIGVSGRGSDGFHNIGGQFQSFSNGVSDYNRGVESIAFGSDVENTGGYFVSSGSSTSSVNYGIYSAASGGNITRAGLFNGDVEIINGMLVSDQKFKTNVEDIKSATDILRKLKPHTYKMDVAGFPQFNFEDRMQYGFIAQEVAGVLPTLVHDSHMPSELDSLGNEIHPAVDYKSLNYNAFIPITVQAVNELNERLDKATLSDQNVKTNVQNLANSLDKVKQMRGVSYEWSSTAQNDMNLDSLQHIGFIAQEVAAIEPLLTFVDDSSLVHVNYDRVVPLLVESVKELDGKVQSKDSIIENLETRLAYLEECIARANICEEGNRTMNNEPNNTTNNRSIELVNINSIILDQNMPNPFAENTVINYNIPTEVMEAKLLFYDLNGRIIKELIIEERGESKLTVYGTNLKTGVYTYSLIADGELIATKKMVKK